MAAELTLSQGDYDVFLRVPMEWWDERFVACEIGGQLGVTSGSVLRRISRFVVLGLVERRGGLTLTSKTEIRRVAK